MYNTLEEKKIVFDEMGRAISKALQIGRASCRERV